jgi:23S rRNA (adenine2030-N6)-methyltransferase
MFSYRHGFHAGNHADVLKHITLINTLTLLHKKDTPLMLVDTHAGAGVYDLNDRFSQTSREANEGVLKLLQTTSQNTLSKGIQEYLRIIQDLQKKATHGQAYPGSPYLLWQSLRANDKLRLMELHPTEFPLIDQLFVSIQQKKQDVQVLHKDGFSHLKAFLPPPSRRGLILIDPSYEDKNDFYRVLQCLQEAFLRFANGVYLIWYPLLQRLDAQDFPKRLEKLCTEKNLPWLQAELRIKSAREDGLSASGMWIINPPWQLKEMLEEDLPMLQSILGMDASASFKLQQHEL